MLLRLLKIADYAMKTPILEAIIMLYQQDSLANTKVVIDTLMGYEPVNLWQFQLIRPLTINHSVLVL